MKHAYLIIAHHEFEVLHRLVKALDDERNDIYIHFDSKVKSLPVLNTELAHLHILKKRINVRWGDISQIAVEIALFQEAAQNGSYTYYHLLSGVDMPIRSQDFIHDFFTQHSGYEFIGFSEYDSRDEIDRKVRRYHLFSAHFKGGNLLHTAVRALLLQLQIITGILRHKKVEFKKGSNWVSVTEAFVHFLLTKRGEIMRDYQYTYCADEIFLQTLCWNSAFRNKLFSLDNDALGCIRRINWKDNKVLNWESDDFNTIMASDAVFARKFSSSDIALVDRILNKVRRDYEAVN